MDDSRTVPSYPLAVDLDRTLLKTDTLVEQTLKLLFQRPWVLPKVLFGLLKGRAELKRRLTDECVLDPSECLFDEDLVSYLREQRAGGRVLHLVTASNQRSADIVGRELGLFETATGTSSATNLKGRHKLEHLTRTFPDGFAYAGDSTADLVIWKSAKSAVLVGVSEAVRKEVGRMGTAVEADIRRDRPRVATWLSLMRVHQWSKNLLLFVPFFLSQDYADASTILALLTGFVALSLAASGNYILNDIADIGADRAHRTKRERPVAKGLIDAGHAFVVALVLLFAGIALAGSVSLLAAGLVVVYLAAALSYSMFLKRLAIADIFTLGGLYTLRVAIGMVLIGAAISHWLLVFSFVFFFSLSMAKRHVEIVNGVKEQVNGPIKGRGYTTDDAPLTLSLGVGSMLLSLLVLSLYVVMDVYALSVYTRPAWLWAAVLLVAGWGMRIWLFSHRGELDDDPVAFALRDRASLLMGVGTAAALMMAAS